MATVHEGLIGSDRQEGTEAKTRRSRSKQERRLIVEETFAPGASVAVIARAHGVNANQVFHWRKLYKEGSLDPKVGCTELLPVRISDVASPETRHAEVAATGIIHIDLGRAKLRIEGVPHPDTLRAVLECVLQ